MRKEKVSLYPDMADKLTDCYICLDLKPSHLFKI